MRGWSWQTRLTLRLIEVDTGRHLWAHCADGAIGEDSAPREHLATRIAAALQPCLRLAEIDRAQQKPDGQLGPHDLALRAMPGVLSLDAEGNARALDLLERAMALDPNHALATALAAWAHVQRVVYHFTATPVEERARSADLARKAQALAGDATGLAVLGNALTLLRSRSTAARPGRGAATAGSTSTRATPNRPSSGSRSRSTLRRTIPLPSTTWSASAVHISRPATISNPPIGRSVRSPRIHRRPGFIGLCAPPMCRAAPGLRRGAAWPPCRNAIPGSRSPRCSKACHLCRQATAIVFSTLCAPSDFQPSAGPAPRRPSRPASGHPRRRASSSPARPPVDR